MLPDRNRMRRREEFTSAVRGGRRVGSRRLVVHVRADPSAAAGDSTRVGFVVSRAVGRAVVRNRVRRRLRHLMVERLHGFPGGSLVVVRATRAAAAASFAELAADVDRVLARLYGRQDEVRR